MPIPVLIEGKKVAEFPDGTDQSVIDQVIKRDFFGKVGTPPPSTEVRSEDMPLKSEAEARLPWKREDQPGIYKVGGDIFPFDPYEGGKVDPKLGFLGLLGESLMDPTQILANLAGGYAQGGIKGAVDWALAGVPSIVRGGRAGISNLLRGISAKEVEKRIPAAATTPTRIRPPSAAGQPTVAAAVKPSTMGWVKPWEEPRHPGPEITGFHSPMFQEKLPGAAISRKFPAMRKGLSTAEPIPQPRSTPQPTPTPQPTATAQPGTPPPISGEPVTNQTYLRPSQGARSPLTPPPSVRPLPGGQFVDEAPINLSVETTMEGRRTAFSGMKNAQAFRGNLVAKRVRELVPDSLDREALTIFRDSGGDIQRMRGLLSDPKFAEYRPVIERALNLPPNALDANQFLDQYFRETGRVGQKMGFLNDVRDDYINRIWQRDRRGNLIISQPQITLPTTTTHALPRKFDTVIDGIEFGAKPLTLDAADLTTVHSGEFAKTLTNNKMINSLKDIGVSIDIPSGSRPPSGYQRIGTTNSAIPDDMAIGLKAILEPNFMAKIDALRSFQKYQGLVKAIDLSLSFFHHFTMGMQAFYQTKGGWDVMFGAELPKIIKLVRSPAFEELEMNAIKNGMVTANVDANMDVLRSLALKQGALGKVVNAPIIKQGFKLMDMNNEFLFGNLQRWLKVMDYSKKSSAWIARHPGATEEAISAASRSLSKEVASAYGGLNWEVLGRTPTFVSLNRALLLAPDWTWSNYYLAKQALQSGPGAAAARMHFITALVGAGVMTEGLSKVLSGHFTDQNAPGHEFEVEVRPGVYVSFMRGGIGDLLRIANLTKELGVVGPIHFAAGKSAPLIRTGVGWLGNVTPTGQKLFSFEKDWWENTQNFLEQAALTSGPMPFGVSQDIREMRKGVTDPWSYILSSTGVGRPGQTSEEAGMKPLPKVRRERLKKVPTVRRGGGGGGMVEITPASPTPQEPTEIMRK